MVSSALDSVSLEPVVLIFQIGICSFGLLVWNFGCCIISFGFVDFICCFANFSFYLLCLGKWAPEAGGTGWRDPGEPSGLGDETNIFDRDKNEISRGI